VKNQVRWLRTAYWWGIIQDIFYSFPFLSPEKLKQPLFGIDALVFAWTLLLIWADRKPLERKGVMLFTTIIVAIKIIQRLMREGLHPDAMWGAQWGTLALFASSYLNASRKKAS
jgi:hypothetical protein